MFYSDLEKQEMRKVIVGKLFSKEEDEEMEGGFAKMKDFTAKESEPTRPIGQACLAFGLCLPLIIWMCTVDAPSEACGIPVKMWLMTYWVTLFADLLLQCVAFGFYRPMIFLSLIINLFLVAWLIYGFAMWNKDGNDCRETAAT